MVSPSAEHQDVIAALREGLADVKAGRVKPARAALKKLAKKYRINLKRKRD